MPPNTSPDTNPLELARQLANVARLGTIAAVDLGAARCRVKTGDNETDWLPWFTGRAAGEKGSQWWPPVKGEQCMVLATGGDMGQGCVLLGVYSDRMAAPSKQADTCRTQFSKQDYSETAKGEHLLHMDKRVRFEVAEDSSITIGQGNITLQAGGATLSIGPDKITANVDVIAQGISLVNHPHKGVQKGQALTEGPVPA
ncbi:phage baseplate assembly protein V [Comamonas sp. MYb21]|uniref:phage baseplate assembly protein V n=1 Tax=Comamonas sp. MYb21 TaxID=1848648 RepID=UPI0030A691AB